VGSQGIARGRVRASAPRARPTLPEQGRLGRTVRFNQEPRSATKVTGRFKAKPRSQAAGQVQGQSMGWCLWEQGAGRRSAVAEPETSHNTAQNRTNCPGLSSNRAPGPWAGCGLGVPGGAGQDH